MSSSSAWDRRIPNNGDLSQSPVYAGTCSTTSGYLPDPRICIFFLEGVCNYSKLGINSTMENHLTKITYFTDKFFGPKFFVMEP